MNYVLLIQYFLPNKYYHFVVVILGNVLILLTFNLVILLKALTESLESSFSKMMRGLINGYLG